MKKCIAFLLCAMISVSCLTGLAAEAVSFQLDIDASKKGVDISPDLFGIFFEDISFSFDGGIYPERVNNRSFEFFERYDMRSGLISDPDIHIKKWAALGGATFEAENKEGFGLNDVNTYYLNLTIAAPGDGLSNEGNQGVAVKAGEKYNISMYVKNAEPDMKVITKVEKDGTVYAEGVMENPVDTKYGDWKKIMGIMSADETVDGAVLNFYFEKAGQYYIDFISVYPQSTYDNRENGLRTDFVEILKALNPGFIRYPGGCVVEGNPMIETRFQWKKSLGPIEERENNICRWTSRDNDTYHYMTYGFGVFEWLLLCEDLGAKPIYVLNAGVACSGEIVPWSEMEWYVQDALDFIEFATGDASTEWGAKRAQLGHPEPFQLEYLAFGNENEGQDFLDRYLYLAQQIKAKYPEMKLVGSAGRGAAHGDLGAIWQVKWAMENVDTTYAVDEHLYKNADYYTTAATRYDVYDRSSGLKVFAGEYACRADNKLKSALADANFMAGFERNADLVTLACYAPLFAKYNYSSWAPNLIWFDNTQVVGMPTYYTHLMYGNNMGDYTIENTLAYCDSLMNHGSFGFYTDGVAARFYDFQVVSNKTGEVIAQKTAQEMLAEGTVIGGNWSVDGGALVQSSLDETAKLVLPGDFEDYTVTFKVTKTDQVDRNSNAGLLFNYVDEDNFYVLQGNEKNYSRVVVRHTSNGFTEGTGKPDGDCTMFVVGNEVEVKLVNDGLHFYGFVMNDPNANNIFKEGFEGLRTWGDFITATPETKANATVSFDRESEEIIVKLINYSDLDHPTLININNAPALSSRARRIVMQNDDMNVGNDLENPTNIAPVEDVMDGISGQFTYTMPKHSFTVLRISVKDDINNILSVNDPEPITTKVGIVPELPAMLPAVNALLTGTTVSVEWETRDDSLYSLPGIYEISGSVAESAIRVTQTIIVEE